MTLVTSRYLRLALTLHLQILKTLVNLGLFQTSDVRPRPRSYVWYKDSGEAFNIISFQVGSVQVQRSWDI
jgi:hypothetical protein